MAIGDSLWPDTKHYDHAEELRSLRMKWPTSVAFLRGGAVGRYCWMPAWRERLIEAAEEIERLQAEVAELKTHVG